MEFSNLNIFFVIRWLAILRSSKRSWHIECKDKYCNLKHFLASMLKSVTRLVWYDRYGSPYIAMINNLFLEKRGNSCKMASPKIFKWIWTIFHLHWATVQTSLDTFFFIGSNDETYLVVQEKAKNSTIKSQHFNIICMNKPPSFSMFLIWDAEMAANSN